MTNVYCRKFTYISQTKFFSNILVMLRNFVNFFFSITGNYHLKQRSRYFQAYVGPHILDTFNFAYVFASGINL